MHIPRLYNISCNNLHSNVHTCASTTASGLEETNFPRDLLTSCTCRRLLPPTPSTCSSNRSPDRTVRVSWRSLLRKSRRKAIFKEIAEWENGSRLRSAWATTLSFIVESYQTLVFVVKVKTWSSLIFLNIRKHSFCSNEALNRSNGPQFIGQVVFAAYVADARLFNIRQIRFRYEECSRTWSQESTKVFDFFTIIFSATATKRAPCSLRKSLRKALFEASRLQGDNNHYRSLVSFLAFESDLSKNYPLVLKYVDRDRHVLRVSVARVQVVVVFGQQIDVMKNDAIVVVVMAYGFAETDVQQFGAVKLAYSCL